MPSKEAKVTEIILELAQLAEKKKGIFDPYARELIREARATVLSESGITNVIKEEKDEFYSVKDVAEMFDVTIQSVYKWIYEGKIEFVEDDSPGKEMRKGYKIPKSQFKKDSGAFDERVFDELDPTFKERREEEMNSIPDTGLEVKPFVANGERRVMKRSDIKKTRG